MAGNSGDSCVLGAPRTATDGDDAAVRTEVMAKLERRRANDEAEAARTTPRRKSGPTLERRRAKAKTLLQVVAGPEGAYVDGAGFRLADSVPELRNASPYTLVLLGVIIGAIRRGMPGIQIAVAKLAELSHCASSTARVHKNALRDLGFIVETPDYDDVTPYKCRGKTYRRERNANIYTLSPSARLRWKKTLDRWAAWSAAGRAVDKAVDNPVNSPTSDGDIHTHRNSASKGSGAIKTTREQGNQRPRSHSTHGASGASAPDGLLPVAGQARLTGQQGSGELAELMAKVQASWESRGQRRG